MEEPIHYLKGSVQTLPTEQYSQKLFEESDTYEEAAIEWVLTDGANEFMWTTAYERAYEKWLNEGDEE